MFPGPRDADWSALEHAYSSAEDVPDILRGLASDLEAEREWALDAFYGAVRHQLCARRRSPATKRGSGSPERSSGGTLPR